MGLTVKDLTVHGDDHDGDTLKLAFAHPYVLGQGSWHLSRPQQEQLRHPYWRSDCALVIGTGLEWHGVAHHYRFHIL